MKTFGIQSKCPVVIYYIVIYFNLDQNGALVDKWSK